MAPAKQENGLPATTEEKEFALALASPLIKDSPVEELKKVLRLCMVKVGLREQNWPGDMDKAVLHAHIIENFGGNRIDEIKLAFEMAIGGKLEIEVNCFENFSCYYFSSIMNAYRAWSTQAHKQIKAAPPIQTIYTSEVIKNEHRGITEACFQRFRNGNATYFPKALMTDILREDGLLPKGVLVEKFFASEIQKGKKNLYQQ